MNQYIKAEEADKAWQEHLKSRRHARKMARQIGYTIQEQLEVSKHLPRIETCFILMRDGIQERLIVTTEIME